MVGRPEKHITHIQVEIRVGTQQEKKQELNTVQAEWKRTWVWGRIILGLILNLLDSSHGILGMCGHRWIVFVFLFYPERLRASFPII